MKRLVMRKSQFHSGLNALLRTSIYGIAAGWPAQLTKRRRVAPKMKQPAEAGRSKLPI
jgi:hypothetical protein